MSVSEGTFIFFEQTAGCLRRIVLTLLLTWQNITLNHLSLTDLMMKTPLTLVALFCASTVVSFAESKEVEDQVFKNFDANHDGSVSLDEYKAGMRGQMVPERVPTVFKVKDLDGDGKLNRTELFVNPDDILKKQAEKKGDTKTQK